MVYSLLLKVTVTAFGNRSEVYLMADLNALTNTYQNASPDPGTPEEPGVEIDAELEEELEELVIEDFTIDGICGVY